MNDEIFRRVLVPDGRAIIGIRPRRVMEQMAFVQYGFTMYESEQAAALLTDNGFQLDAVLVEPEPNQVFFGKAISMESVLICGCGGGHYPCDSATNTAGRAPLSPPKLRYQKLF